MNFILKFADNFVHSNSLAYTAMRSTLTSQASGWIDFAVGFAMFAWVGFQPVYATAVGAVAGGIFNCIVNFKFTYHKQNYRWDIVIVKFIMIWFGGLLLNSFGTQGLYWLLNKWEWLVTIGFKPDGFYTAARLATALIVSIFWNFLMQKNFVYKEVKFDATAMKIAKFFSPKLHKEPKESQE